MRISDWSSDVCSSDLVTTWLTLEYNRRRDTAGTDVVDLSAPEGVNLSIARGGISGQNRSEVATALADPTRQRDYSAHFRVEAHLGPVDLTSISTYMHFRQTAPHDADVPSEIGRPSGREREGG